MGSTSCKQLNIFLLTRPSWSSLGRVHAYLPSHYTTRAAPHVFKACSRRSIKCWRDVWVGRLQGQASTADLQPDHSALPQWWVVQQLWADSGVRQAATVRLQPGASTVGHLSGTVTSLVMQQHHTVPLTECRVADDNTRNAHAVEDIICYS
jgi:hypothetical protein